MICICITENFFFQISSGGVSEPRCFFDVWKKRWCDVERLSCRPEVRLGGLGRMIPNTCEVRLMSARGFQTQKRRCSPSRIRLRFGPDASGHQHKRRRRQQQQQQQRSHTAPPAAATAGTSRAPTGTKQQPTTTVKTNIDCDGDKKTWASEFVHPCPREREELGLFQHFLERYAGVACLSGLCGVEQPLGQEGDDV